MKTTAAICWEVNADWSIEEIDLDPPQGGRVTQSGGVEGDEDLPSEGLGLTTQARRAQADRRA